MSMAHTVFMVDDSKTARMMAKHWITAQFPGIQVIEAGSGEEAVTLFEQLPPIFTALLDYNMPGMRGVDLAAKLQEQFPEARLLLVTANIQEAVQEQARTLGIEFVPKPLNPPKIKKILDSVGTAS
jgi:CheY-like chemotaxis protein